MYSVLLIDDDAAILNMLQMALSKRGIAVTTATNGEAGMRMFDDACFDLVITDIRMPDVDGNTVAKHIRNSARGDIPIMAITGTPWLPDKMVFDKILQKPFQLRSLLDSVHALISDAVNAAAC
jgi:two-component system copper resistance phosphate regulon response regulator CusR